MGKELNSSWMPTREAFDEKTKNQCRVSLVIREPLESADLSLGDGELVAGFVKREVGLRIILPERFVSFSGFPEIASQVGAVTGGVTQEESSLVRRVAPKQLGPIPIRPIYAFKPFVTSWLDIELPEG
jgi:hypothetical protein